MKVFKTITQYLWLLCGLLMLVVLALAINIGLDIRASVKEVTSQVTIEDIRHGLNIVEKQIDNNTLALQIEQKLYEHPLEDTAENRQAFKDFCERTGYTEIEYNWQRFIYGKLKP